MITKRQCDGHSRGLYQTGTLILHALPLLLELTGKEGAEKYLILNKQCVLTVEGRRQKFRFPFSDKTQQRLLRKVVQIMNASIRR